MKKVSSNKVFFADFSETEIAKIIDSSEVVFCEEGNYLFKQGEASNSFYIVSTGELEVIYEDVVNTVTIAKAKSGSIIGEVGFLDKKERTASIKALTDVVALCISDKAFDEMEKDDKFLSFKVIKEIERVLASRLIQSNKNLINSKIKDISDKFIKQIINLDNPSILGSEASDLFFSQLNDKEISKFIKKTNIGIFNEGDFLFREGEESDSFHVIFEGEVEVSIQNENGRNDLISLGVGSIVGEVGFLDNSTRTASVRALKDTKTFFISKTSFDKLKELDIDLSIKLLREVGIILCERLRLCDKSLVDTTEVEINSRLLSAISSSKA